MMTYLQSLNSPTSREFTIDEVGTVVRALGGYKDEGAGSRVKLALRHPITGHEHSRTIHNHISFGHKGLEAGRMKSIRELFLEVDMTLDTVQQRAEEVQPAS